MTRVRRFQFFPLDAKMVIETEANECSFKTASGELIPDHGALCVQGTTRAWSAFPREESKCSQNSDQRKQSSQ